MSKKHYVITSITLGLIAASSGALIGLTNLLTKDKIIENENNKINAGICEIFGKTATISSKSDISGYKYTSLVYHVTVEENDQFVAFKTEGSNMYGKVSLLVGFNLNSNDEYVFTGLSVITNEQTYASTLVANYLEPLNKGERELDDVTCGATYGAKLVRDMVNEAKEAANKL